MPLLWRVRTVQNNLKAKYHVTDAELKRVVDQINLGKFFGDPMAIIAVCDLLLNGDVAPVAKDEDGEK